ncbi:MAG: LolA family protein, partial [Bacteroidota bacterium]
MKKLLLTMVTLGLIASQLMAQTDPKAQEILKGVSAKYKSYKTLSASFKLNLLDQKSKKTTAQSGTVALKGS